MRLKFENVSFYVSGASREKYLAFSWIQSLGKAGVDIRMSKSSL